jgi:hypothetical protein
VLRVIPANSPEVTHMANPLDAIGLAIRNKVESLTEADLQQHKLEVELQKERARAQAAEARVRHIEQALKTAGRVLQPYLSGTRR